MRTINNKTILVTGGLGFIGINFINRLFKKYNKIKIINIDKITNISNHNNDVILKKKNNYKFFKIDIANKKSVNYIFNNNQIDIVINFAAESHVDNSIKNPSKFIQSNIVGVNNLIEASMSQWMTRPNVYKKKFRESFFLQISTDEVFGSIPIKKKIDEKAKFFPSSPYSASKASAENLIYSYYKTFGLNMIISNSSNNYGPFQNKEKFIPNSITSIIKNRPITLYGDGKNIRDWIHVSDNCDAIIKILLKGSFGESYIISSNDEMSNIRVLEKLISIGSSKLNKKLKNIKDKIIKVKDRPGHDFRYGIKSNKLKKLGWKPKISFNAGIDMTFEWYIKKLKNEKKNKI